MTQALRNRLLNAPASNRSHAGLLMTRYSPEAVGKGNEDSREQLLQSVKKAVENPSTISLYKVALERWKRSFVESDFAGSSLCPRMLEFRAASTIIVGLGGDNVTETGLTLHHTYGVPYLPGAAIKGLAAHYAHQVWGASEPRWRMATSNNRTTGSFHATMFGISEGDAGGAGGLIDFSDGWIAAPNGNLVLDVITPHHGDYYMASDDKVETCPPTDFDSPIPNPFLSVKGTFFIVLSKRDRRLPDEWLDRAEQLLEQSLGEWGIGGKTNADYGRMKLQRPDNVELPVNKRPAIAGAKNDLSASSDNEKPEKPNPPPVAPVETVQVRLLRQNQRIWTAALVNDEGEGTIHETSPINNAKPQKIISVKVISSSPKKQMRFEYPAK